MGGAPAVTPGLAVADRYRLEAVLSSAATPARTDSSPIGQLWRAHDDVLARQVAVLLVPEDDPDVPSVLSGARAAARLTQASLVRVYDAGVVPGFAFVVTEYLPGGSLEQQLLIGPLDTSAAIELVAELAIGVAAAHEAGLHGIALAPRNVLFTSTGLPRLAGIALAGHPDGDPEAGDSPRAPDADQASRARYDSVGLARLLYATLTARWPGDAGDSALPAAPFSEGHLCTPRQVRGGVPREVDLLVAQALGDDLLRRGLPEVASPAAFAAALDPLRSALDDGHPYGADTQPKPDADSRGGRRPLGPSLVTYRWRWWALGIGVVLVGVAVLALANPGGSTAYLHFATRHDAPPSTAAPSTSASAHAAAAGLVPFVVKEFDPYGDHTDPHVAEVPRAVDGNPATAWHTQTFKTADLGKLKPGVGLLVDLGRPRKVGAVHLRLIGTGTTLALLDSNGQRDPATDKAMTIAAQQSAAPADITLKPPGNTTARYWVIWLTRLPASGSGFQAGIAEMTFEP